ncbi:hypothetical protein J3Q64DRAFT_1860108 [Phycomyces blakesleeanus]|uniref:Uncharacterized protein n=2 Tax=Phycomyces blakesleeanus TaxID=4837 RepID=A0A167RFC1_PHYB8|nr:hypothetical protein PHYBLDRAFT_139052 [Phycomyces blakesleeanus NRRL 1555(-)]XP_018299558.1 hypothetical protein PHYBLDRAFT_139061 [Phycomyces blakesleeanus NRRL 1555(-)]OAD81510.1 hypothetical protein PHYBLDRAFT_139052 [Phycomyces blakesleeanus NRRL 1555(-)]OAD81518.1 hypothetical protein PHYBLDRAFT_139061 [Phycomyces blakesleeanus NRRL 1555(-)]|eukprot:XP_018299550.1 hypothetical protein PHYBLDRAFT_139052 [Phycomyces blakesleeanus NRRL 1555(-)]
MAIFSPVLLNFTLETLVLSIFANHTFLELTLHCSSPPLTIKLLTYTNDVFGCLFNPADITRLQNHLKLNVWPSNARINMHENHEISFSDDLFHHWNAPL